MYRFSLVGLAILASTVAAAAQVGQFPQVPPPVPSLGAGAPPPLLMAPPPAPLPNSYGPPSTVFVPGHRAVQVPGAPPGRNSFSDRVERCIHAGTAAGIKPNDVGSFSAQCAN